MTSRVFFGKVRMSTVMALVLATALVQVMGASPASAQDQPVEVKQITTGWHHTCAIQTDNSPICWGANDAGQSTPPDGLQVTDIVTGRDYSCALQVGGEPICWGDDAPLPPAGVNLGSISGGYRHVCGLDLDGGPICWGWNDFGQSAPPDDVTMFQISAGTKHTCGLVETTPVCWGDNTYDRLEAPSDVVLSQVAAGHRHTCAVQIVEFDSVPICWGDNSAQKSTPPAGLTVQQVSAGYNHSCALQSGGEPICWGSNADLRSTPPEGLNAVAVSAGGFHSCAVTVDRTPVCWGANNRGQSTVPVVRDLQPSAANDEAEAVVGSDFVLDLCANDELGNGDHRVTRIDGWYGPGLSRSNYSCIITGTPTEVGTYFYRYLLTDEDGDSAEARVRIRVNSAVDRQPIARDDRISGTVGEVFEFDICANDDPGDGPPQPTRVSGWYGPGVARGNWCIIGGRPTTAGTFNYTYRLTDANGDTDTADVVITINP